MVHLNKGTTIRSLASELHVSKNKFHKVFKEGLIRPHSRCPKFYMKEENKKNAYGSVLL